MMKDSWSTGLPLALSIRCWYLALNFAGPRKATHFDAYLAHGRLRPGQTFSCIARPKLFSWRVPTLENPHYDQAEAVQLSLALLLAGTAGLACANYLVDQTSAAGVTQIQAHSPAAD